MVRECLAVSAAGVAARGGAKTIVCDPLYKMGGVETDSLIGWYCFGNRVGFTAEIDEGIRSLGPDGEQTRAEWFRRGGMTRPSWRFSGWRSWIVV